MILSDRAAVSSEGIKDDAVAVEHDCGPLEPRRDLREQLKGDCTLSPRQRITGVTGSAMRARRSAVRLTAECQELAVSKSLTIADGSYFSMLMEVNKAITSSETVGGDDVILNDVIQQLIHDGVFLKMLKNHYIIAMSKHSESDRIIPDIPDRITMEYVLEPGEFTIPRRLQDFTKGNFGRTFGVEQRSFRASDWRWVRDCYQESLGAISESSSSHFQIGEAGDVPAQMEAALSTACAQKIEHA
jgi:hypothetical protein